jgi:hypothetical protein
MSLRSRFSGAGFKPLQVAVIKSDGREHWSKSVEKKIQQVGIRKTNNPEPLLTRRKPEQSTKTESVSISHYKSTGNLITV